MNNKVVKVASLLVASAVNVNAFAETKCSAVLGSVKLAPTLACDIETAVPGFAYIVGVPNTCFSVSLTLGRLSIAGVAGLTAESMIHPLQSSQTVLGTPAMLNERGLVAATNEFGIPETRRLFTARSALFFPKGTVYTADAGVIAGASSTEQLLITGGTGAYAQASGTLYATGDLLGKGGAYFGKICTPG